MILDMGDMDMGDRDGRHEKVTFDVLEHPCFWAFQTLCHHHMIANVIFETLEVFFGKYYTHWVSEPICICLCHRQMIPDIIS